MRITQQISPHGATESELSSLEAVAGAILPADYRLFLAEFNGGRPDPGSFVAQDGNQGSRVQFFFTTDKSNRTYSIESNIKVYQGRIPTGLVPIACDSFGNLLLLDVAAKRPGAIYFWSHEDESSEDEPHWDNVFFVADSFGDLIAGLR